MQIQSTPTYLCSSFSRCLKKPEWGYRSLFSKANCQKLQVDGTALALNGIYVSAGFTRYECFRSLEIITGTKLFFKIMIILK